MSNYVVAAEGTRVLMSKAIGGPANARPKTVPAGTCHAAVLGEERAACGVSVSMLTVLDDLPWEPGSFLTRCSKCLAAAR